MPTLKIDLHTHLKVSKRAALRPHESLRFARMLRERGLHALAVTEHFHAPGFWQMYETLLANHPYRHGRFEVDGSLFFVGAELTLAEGADAVLISTLPDLRAIDEAFPTPLSSGYHPTAPELSRTLSRIGSLAVRIVAHPYRVARGLAMLDQADAASLFHAAEINARFCEREAVDGAGRWAKEHHAAVVAGSDAHVWSQVGAAWTEVEFDSAARRFPRIDSFGRVRLDDLAVAARRAMSAGPPEVSFEDLRDALLSGAPERVAPAVHRDAERICAEGAALKASLKAVLPKVQRNHALAV